VRIKTIACAAAMLFVATAAFAQLPSGYEPARMRNGHPDLNGIWQAAGTANWNLEAHPPQQGPIWETGAIGSVPGGPGVVAEGAIPYQPAALEQRKKNFDNRRADDPEAKCYLPGVPRATYMPYPFQIVQGDADILMVYEYATASRRINMGKPREVPIDTWMGMSNGRWEGNTLVVDVTAQNGLAWLDRAGNFASSQVRVRERFTPVSPYHMEYQATVEDASVFTAPWTIKLMLYRRVEPGVELIDFKCVEFVEELLYGKYKKQPGKK
jgi:hypothetical protein